MKLSRRMLRLYVEAGRLFSLDVELTYRCPLRCRHCYQRGYHSLELSTEEWVEVMDDARAMGVVNFGFTGGEVLVRSDFSELLGAAAKRGFRVFINTTGSGANEDTIEAFAAARPAQVDVSFYAADATSHDALTGRPGSFDESLQFVRTLVGRGLFVRGAFTPLRGISDDPIGARDALIGLGVPRVVWNRFDHTICRDQESAQLLVPDPASLSAIVQEESTVGRFKVADAICGAGISSLLVRPDGMPVPCHAMAMVLGNVTQESLQSIWSNSPILAELRARSRSQLPHCTQCPDWEACGYCPAEAERITGDWRDPAPGFCHRLGQPKEVDK